MTLQELNDSLYPKPVPVMPKAQEEIPPTLMLYEVTLIPHSGGEWQMGRVATHLSIEDWAELHHFSVLTIGNVRPALAGEKTDLA